MRIEARSIRNCWLVRGLAGGLIVVISFTNVIAQGKTCEVLFVAQTARVALRSSDFPLLKKSGIPPSDLKITTSHRQMGRIWIDIDLVDGTPIGHIGLSPQGRDLFGIEIAQIQWQYQARGLGFVLHAVAALVAQREGKILASSRTDHSKSEETL
jgi:hypothetical protein